MGKEQDFEDVMESVTIRYNNMVKQKLWSEMNPKDAKILALATINNQFQKYKGGGSSNSGEVHTSPAAGGSNSAKEWKFNLEPWCIVKEGSTKVVDRRT